MDGARQGVMVVAAADGGVPDLFPALLVLADLGLRGDRQGVYDALQRLRVDMRLGRMAFAGGSAGDMAEQLALVMERSGSAGARTDVLVAMRNLGTIGDVEFVAGMELRRVAEAMRTAAIGVRAIDPSKPVVDGGAPWCDPEVSRGIPMSPMVRRAVDWARYVDEQACGPVGRRSRATPAALIHRVAVENVALRDLDRQLGVRKGTSARVVKAGLGLYAAMHGADLMKPLDPPG